MNIQRCIKFILILVKLMNVKSSIRSLFKSNISRGTFLLRKLLLARVLVPPNLMLYPFDWWKNLVLKEDSEDNGYEVWYGTGR